MGNQQNKVKFGLKNAHYALITNESTPTFGTPVPIPGSVNLSLKPKGATTDFYADDDLYYHKDNNAGYDGELEIADIKQDFETACLGRTLDSDGCVVESTNDEPAYFALLFEIDGDQHARKNALFKCIASRPEIDAGTKGESAEPKTSKIAFVASPLNGKVKRTTGPDATNADEWYESVQFPAATPSI